MTRNVTDMDSEVLSRMIIDQQSVGNLPAIDELAASAMVLTVQYLTEYALMEVGLYRVPGSAVTIDV